jgi:hypothetical protein
VILASLHQPGQPPFAGPCLGWQRPFAGAPDTDRRLDADGVNQPKIAQFPAKLAIRSIAGIDKDNAHRRLSRKRSADLINRNLRFDLEYDLFGDLRFLPTLGTIQPDFREVRLPGNRQAGALVRN